MSNIPAQVAEIVPAESVVGYDGAELEQSDEVQAELNYQVASYTSSSWSPSPTVEATSCDENWTGMASQMLPGSRRPTSRRALRGEVTVVVSSRLKFPRFHLDESCEGLINTHVEARTHLTFADAYELGSCPDGRPCRLCALEPVLRAVLNTKKFPVREPVLFTASAQSAPTREDVRLYDYEWATVSDSASSRLRRVARSSRTSSTLTSIGPVLYGIRDRRCVEVVSMNLRTAVAPNVDIELDELTVQTLWTLLTDNPPELAAPRFENFGTNPADADGIEKRSECAGEEIDIWSLASRLSR
jgi:hypothetical protein